MKQNILQKSDIPENRFNFDFWNILKPKKCKLFIRHDNPLVLTIFKYIRRFFIEEDYESNMPEWKTVVQTLWVISARIQTLLPILMQHTFGHVTLMRKFQSLPSLNEIKQILIKTRKI